MTNQNNLVLLVSPKGKRYLRVLDPSGSLHTHDGKLEMAAVAEAGYGAVVKTHLGRPYRVLKPTLHDLIKGVKRETQIMYPKEIGYLVLKLGIGPGARVIEAGTGSGGLTVALSWFVGDTGRVYTYERRGQFHRLAAKNLERAGMLGRVELIERDIEEGFAHTDADALFLDVRTPWEYLHHIPSAVIPGAMTGYLLPTANQVCDLLHGLERGPFTDIEVLEILVRHYKPVAERLRPEDRMVAHTGFLVFARCMPEPPEFDGAAQQEPEAEEAAEPVGVALPEAVDPGEPEDASGE